MPPHLSVRVAVVAAEVRPVEEGVLAAAGRRRSRRARAGAVGGGRAGRAELDEVGGDGRAQASQPLDLAANGLRPMV